MILRSARSVEIDIESSISSLDLARSFERTKAEGNKLERVSVRDSCLEKNFLRATVVETILRSRPNLQVLNVTMSSSRDLNGVCQAVASSTVTTFTCYCRDMSSTRVEAAFAKVGELLQHDLQLRINTVSQTDDHYKRLLCAGYCGGVASNASTKIPFDHVYFP